MCYIVQQENPHTLPRHNTFLPFLLSYHLSPAFVVNWLYYFTLAISPKHFQLLAPSQHTNMQEYYVEKYYRDYIPFSIFRCEIVFISLKKNFLMGQDKNYNNFHNFIPSHYNKALISLYKSPSVNVIFTRNNINNIILIAYKFFR